MNDKISVKENGTRRKKQKQLLKSTVEECYEKFRKENSDIQVGFSKFASIRPQECILVGSNKDVQKVCCCVHCDNPEMLITSSIVGELNVFRGLIDENLQEKVTARNILKKLVCKNPTDDCWLSSCKDCQNNAALLQEALLSIMRSLGKLSKSICKKYMEFFICREGGVIFHMFSATHQNAFENLKNKNVLELPKNHFKDVKKSCRFSIN